MRRKNFDTVYRVAGRKKPVTTSTNATGHFLGLICEEHPSMTILGLRELLSDREKYIPNPEAIAVLDEHIRAGYGDRIPRWRY